MLFSTGQRVLSPMRILYNNPKGWVNMFKSKNFIMIILALLITVPVCSAAVTDKTPVTQDFTFGLPDEFPFVTPYEEGETGEATFQRFLQLRDELPEEVPVFKPFEPVGEKEVYIAKDGKDTNPGTKDKPVKSFERAFELASQGPVGNGRVIYIREGIYDISDGLTLEEGLSGSIEHPTIISAYPGEEVTLSGSVSVKGSEFKVADDELAMRKLPKAAIGKVYSVNLFDLGYTKLPSLSIDTVPKLTVDDISYTLARWPNASEVPMGKATGEGTVKGVYDIGPVTQVNRDNDPITGDTGEGFEFKFIDPRPLAWENTEQIFISGSFYVEYLRSTKRVRSINPERMSIRTFDHEESGARYQGDNAYYYFNILEELDIPGEWFLDYDTGNLYLWPITEIEDSNVSIANTQETLITFEKSSQYIVLNDVTVSGTGGRGIYLQGFRNLVQNCIVKDTSESAVYIENAKNCGLISSDLYSTVTMWGSIDSNTNYNSDNQSLRPTRNFVQNNCIYGTRINARYGVQQIISHNTIFNAPAQALYIANLKESIIEYNEAVGSPWRTADGGTLYYEGGLDNIYNHIRYNYFHHTTLEQRESPMMIYLDDYSSNTFVYGNIMQMGNCFMHGGLWNVAYNNMVIDCVGESSAGNSNHYVTDQHFSQDVFKNSFVTATGDHVSWNQRGVLKINHQKIKNRYPTLHYYMTELQKIRKDRLAIEDYVSTPFENETKEPQGNVYKNNVSFNAELPSIVETETRYLLENNIVIEDKNNFEDYENRNYNLKKDSEVYDLIDGFEEMPPLSKMGILTEIKEEIVQQDVMPVYPANDPDVKVFPSDILLQWTTAPAVSFYNVEIATDENFENIVYSGRTQHANYQLEKDLDFDTTYYWRVKGESYVNHVENPEVFMKTSSFKTFTYKEAAENTSLNLSVHEGEIEKIKAYADSIIEDDGKDHGIQTFKQGTKAKIYELIELSQKRIEKYALQKEVDEEVANLNNDYLALLVENAADYARTYSADDLSMWATNSADASITADGNILSIKSSVETGNALATDQRMLAPGEKVKIRVKFPLQRYQGIGIKQIDPTAAGNFYNKEGYFFVPTPTAIELQRYPATGGDIIATVPNDGIMLPDQFHDVELSCTPENGGQRIIIVIDGKEIINYFDDVAPNNKFGYFSIHGRFDATQIMCD